MPDTHLRALPATTDNVDRAEHDLRTEGSCAVTHVVDDATLARAHAELYAAAADDRAHGWEQRGFGLDLDVLGALSVPARGLRGPHPLTGVTPGPSRPRRPDSHVDFAPRRAELRSPCWTH